MKSKASILARAVAPLKRCVCSVYVKKTCAYTQARPWGGGGEL